jgi:hypothetical protein
MLEWVALIVLAAVVLVPMLLLLGFAGCNQIYGLDPTVPAPQTTFQTELGQDVVQRNRTVVQRIEPSRLTAGGSKVTITVQRPATGMLRLLNLFVSRASNVADPNRDPYDSANDLAAVLSTELLLQPDATDPVVELPEFNYALDNTQPLLIAFDIGPEGSVPRTDATIAPFEASAYLGPQPAPQQVIHEASLADPDGDRQTGYAMQERIYLVKRIAVR